MRRGKQLIREGDVGHLAHIMQTGWACSYKNLPSGSRQIISFPIAGDCVGLRGVVVAPTDGVSIWQTFSDFPRLGAAMLWAASRDEAMIVERLVSIGRRSATERAELMERMALVGLADDSEFECPLTQDALAEALGLTSVHINRVLRQLRELNLVTAQHGAVTIHDLTGLRQLSGYQGSYLH